MVVSESAARAATEPLVAKKEKKKKRKKPSTGTSLSPIAIEEEREISEDKPGNDHVQTKETDVGDVERKVHGSGKHPSSKKERKKRKRSSNATPVPSNNAEVSSATSKNETSEGHQEISGYRSQKSEQHERDAPQRKKRKRSSKKGEEKSSVRNTRDRDCELLTDGLHVASGPTQPIASSQTKSTSQKSGDGIEKDSLPVHQKRESSKAEPEEKAPSPAKETSKIDIDHSEQKDNIGQGSATDPRLSRTLFVGNVSQEATQKDLKKLFKQFGKVETVRIRGVVPVNPRIPKRTALLTNKFADFSDSFQAYIVFKETDDVADAMSIACEKLNMTVFRDRHIRVMAATQKRQGPRKQSLFLGNLPFDCSDEDVISSFTELADSLGVKIVNVRVNRDKDTGVGRGVGFITFDDALGIQGCINEAGNVKIKDRVVRMEPASKMKKINTKTFKRGRAKSKQGNSKANWKDYGAKRMSAKRRK